MAILKHVRQIIVLLRQQDIKAEIVKGRNDGHLHLSLAVGGVFIGKITVASSPKTPDTAVLTVVRKSIKLKEKNASETNHRDARTPAGHERKGPPRVE